MVPGYGRNGRAARAVLGWLQAHCAPHLDPALVRVVEALVVDVERRDSRRADDG